jgi:hypothetical protein
MSEFGALFDEQRPYVSLRPRSVLVRCSAPGKSRNSRKMACGREEEYSKIRARHGNHADATATLTGRILDPKGLAVPGVQVQAVN